MKKKKKKGGILLFVLVCIGIFGAMLIKFLGATTPRRIFYNSAVCSYGFLDNSQNLHGLLELESESMKNSTLAYIKGRTELMLSSVPLIWNEDALNKLRETLNNSSKRYWEMAGENFIQDFWEIAMEAQSKDSQYDKTRKMYQSVKRVSILPTWSMCKDQEELIVKNILALSSNATKKTLENISKLLQELERLNYSLSNPRYIDERFRSTEIKEIQKILSDVFNNKRAQWQEGVINLKNESIYRNQFKEKITRLMEKLKPPQEERLKELVSLRKIEQSLAGKDSIDANTWQEIKELLSIEKSLPQVDQSKKNFLKELEQKLYSNGRARSQTSEEVSHIRSEILKIFQNSIKDALKQENFENNGSQKDGSLRQLEEDIQSEWFLNTFTSLFPNKNIAANLQNWEKKSEEKLSNDLQNILNSINSDLVNKLKDLATAYDNRISDKNYQQVRNLVKESRDFNEILSSHKDVNRLQSVFAMTKMAGGGTLEVDINGYKKNFNVESVVKIVMLDNKLPLTVKFKSEVKEAIGLIFQDFNIDEKEIASFWDDLEKIIDVLGKPDSIYKPGIPSRTELKEKELEYSRMIIEDFRDTKRDLDINIFREFSSWKAIFKDKDPNIEIAILHYLGASLTFANDIDSINFYAASEFVRRALVYTLPLRPEISNQQKQAANLPSSKDPETIRQEMFKIFNYGLQEGNNDPTKLRENKETIRKILQLLHEAKVANFPEDSNGDIDVLYSYSKAIRIIVLVRDKDYKIPLNRITNYHCKIEYVGNGKHGRNNTVQTIEEL
jgi:hypothetical protein